MAIIKIKERTPSGPGTMHVFDTRSIDTVELDSGRINFHGKSVHFGKAEVAQVVAAMEKASKEPALLIEANAPAKAQPQKPVELKA